MLVFTISPAFKEVVTAAEFGTFAVQYGLPWMGCMKQMLTALLCRKWWRNYCDFGKIQPWPTIYRGPYFYSRPRLNFTSGTIYFFHHSPLEQSIFVYYWYLTKYAQHDLHSVCIDIETTIDIHTLLDYTLSHRLRIGLQLYIEY